MEVPVGLMMQHLTVQFVIAHMEEPTLIASQRTVEILGVFQVTLA